MNGVTPAIDQEALLRLASAGDGAAVATLLAAIEPEILKYVNRRLPRSVHSVASPEDIVQDTCYEACRLIHGFVSQGPTSFHRWVIRIASLRVKAAIHKYRTRRTFTVSGAGDDDASVIAAME